MSEEEKAQLIRNLRANGRAKFSVVALLRDLRQKKAGRIEALSILRGAFGLEIARMQTVMWWAGWGTADSEVADEAVAAEVDPQVRDH